MHPLLLRPLWLPWSYCPFTSVFLGKCLLAKEINPPDAAKTKGEFTGGASPGAGRVFGFVPGSHFHSHPIGHQGVKDLAVTPQRALSGPRVSATAAFLVSTSLPPSCSLSYTDHVATLKWCLQPRAFISISTARSPCPSGLQCRIHGKEHMTDPCLSLPPFP